MLRIDMRRDGGRWVDAAETELTPAQMAATVTFLRDGMTYPREAECLHGDSSVTARVTIDGEAMAFCATSLGNHTVASVQVRGMKLTGFCGPEGRRWYGGFGPPDDHRDAEDAARAEVA